MQLLLDDKRYKKLAREAERRGVSIASVIREAIDMLPEGDSRRRAAVAAILSAEPMEVPDDPAALVRELNEIRERTGR